MKRSIVSTFILLFTILSYLQAQEAYIIKDSTFTVGIKLILPAGINKYQEVIEEKGRNKNLKIYTPDSINEFYVDNKVFVSMPSPLVDENKKVFLHQLVKRDSIAVYRYENKAGSYLFFRENGGNFKEITARENPYAAYITEKYENNSSHPVNSYQIKPTQQSIKFAEKLIYTQNPNLLSRITYGIWAGTGVSNVSKSTIPADNTDTHLFAGLFLNIPIPTYFSIHSEISFMQEAYSYHHEQPNTFIDKIFNRKSIFMPVMLRYSFKQMKGNFIPYLQAGPSAHFALKQKEESRTVRITNDNASIEESPESEKSNFFYLGINAGAGLEYKLTSRRSIFLDIRYMRTFVIENNNILYAVLSVNF